MKMTAPKNDIHNESEDEICNYSDYELIFKELQSKCHLLETERVELLRMKQTLLVLNEQSEIVSKRLLRIKSDCDYYKSHLHKTLCNLKVATAKQKIISQKKVDEFLKKRKEFEEYYKVSPMKHKLEELTTANRKLEEECNIITDLLNLTKRQNEELVNFLLETFKKKVCEFCEIFLRFNGNQNSNFSEISAVRM